MAFQRTIVGAECKVYLNDKLYNEVQSIQWTIDYGEQEIYGVDSVLPQEIAPTKVTVRGRVNGLRVRNSGGLQASGIRPLIFDVLTSPYISLRVQTRSNGEDLIFIPNMKVTKETVSITAKGVLKLNFDFSGVQPQQPLDRSQ